MAETVDISNFNQLLYQLEGLSPQQLQQVGMMHHDDLAVMSAISHINSQRQKAAQAMMAQRAMSQPPMPTVAEQVVQKAATTPLPEEVGLGALPAPNMEGMAGGGITGEDYEVESYAKGGLDRYAQLIREEAARQGMDPDLAIRLFTAESGGDPEAVSPKGAVGMGQLMPAAAKEMGLDPKERTDPVKNIRASIGYFMKQQQKYGSPQLAAAAYNWGPANLDRHLEKNQGQLTPSGLPKETTNYLTKLMPVREAQATPTSDREKLIAQIPGQTGQAPAAVREEPGFFKRQAERLGLSEESQRNIANLNTALAGALGAGYMPSYVPSSGGLLDLARRGGEAVYSRLVPAKGLSQAQIAAMQAERAAQVPIEAAEAARMAGALPAEAETAAAAVRAQQAAQAAQVPSAAERVQAASMAREAAEAARIPQAARVAQQATQAAAAPSLIEGGGAAGAGAAPDGAYDRAESARFLRQATEGAAERLSKDEKKQVIELAKEAAPEGKKQGFTAEDWIQLGLGLMAGESPYAVQNLGKAGLGVLKARQEARKEEREDIYRKALAREAEGKAKYYESGTQGTTAALRAANDQFDNWFNSIKGTPDFMLLQPEQRDAIVERKRQQYLREAFAAYNLPVPTGVSTADAGGFKVLGSRPS